MGTNYYAQPDPCPTCGHGPRAHMCKSLTMWQAIGEWSDGYEVVGEMRSWQDWKRYLLDKRPTIVDEYGETHDVDEFIAAVEATKPEARRRQYDWAVLHAYPLGTDPESEWLCPDGFSFTSREFS